MPHQVAAVNNFISTRPIVSADTNKVIKSSSIKGITERQNSMISHKEWQITYKYTDGTKEKIVVPKDSVEDRRAIFTKHKTTNSSRGWPGTRTTLYFSDGYIEKSTSWRKCF